MITHACTLLVLAPLVAPQEQQEGPTPGGNPQADELQKQFAQHRIQLDLDAGRVIFPTQVTVRDDLLEYLLVGEAGAAHESLLRTTVTPSVLNTALLLLGMTPGENARWEVREPAPTEEELQAGESPYEVHLPQGPGLLPYVAWRQGSEVFFYRLEDLLRNLRTGRSMQRHAWVYLGSRMVPAGRGGEEVFAADIESNLINLSFFPEGHTLLTGAVEDCVFQTIWLPNAWLLPPRGSEVWMILSREKIAKLPPELAAKLPEPNLDAEEDGPR